MVLCNELTILEICVTLYLQKELKRGQQ